MYPYPKYTKVLSTRMLTYFLEVEWNISWKSKGDPHTHKFSLCLEDIDQLMQDIGKSVNNRYVPTYSRQTSPSSIQHTAPGGHSYIPLPLVYLRLLSHHKEFCAFIPLALQEVSTAAILRWLTVCHKGGCVQHP